MTSPIPGIHITVKVDDFTHSILVGAGWTPPGEAPIFNSEHRRALADVRSDQQRTITRMVADHRDELRAERMKSRSEIRAEVAEEIALDLEKPRNWVITVGEPAPWAKVARAHAKRSPSVAAGPTYWLTTCTICSHTVSAHDYRGCHFEGNCVCKQTHGKD